jgi:hypothetical protein
MKRAGAVLVWLCVAGAARAKPSGKIVTHEQLETPRCNRGERPVGLGLAARASSGREPVPVATTPEALRQLVGCSPAARPDFGHVRVAVFKYTSIPAQTFRLAAVTDDGKKIHLAFSVSHICQGIAQRPYEDVALVAIPRDSKPVMADVEYERLPDCRGVP